MLRFRGKRRYFRKVAKAARDFSITPAADDWWSHWHYHADWPGWGNKRWLYRLPHIEALVTVFRTIANAAGEFQTPFQTWLFLSAADTGQDSTFLHTPNPNDTEFPYHPQNAEWGVPELGELLAGFAEFEWQVGRLHENGLDGDDEPINYGNYVAFVGGVGEPLTPESL